MARYRCLHRLDNTAEVLDVPRALTVLCYSQVTGVYRRTDSINNVQPEIPLLWPVYTHCNIKAHPPPYEYTFVILGIFLVSSGLTSTSKLNNPSLQMGDVEFEFSNFIHIIINKQTFFELIYLIFVQDLKLTSHFFQIFQA